jgi:hypothetical protein
MATRAQLIVSLQKNFQHLLLEELRQQDLEMKEVMRQIKPL